MLDCHIEYLQSCLLVAIVHDKKNYIVVITNKLHNHCRRRTIEKLKDLHIPSTTQSGPIPMSIV